MGEEEVDHIGRERTGERGHVATGQESLMLELHMGVIQELAFSTNDRMPAFGKENKLDQRSIELVVDWLRGDWPVKDKKIFF